MSDFQVDPGLLQDFLTESGELLERLDKDLVELEHSPRDGEMLNQVFRALHTIKGSASFLALSNLVAVAHAAEGALNTARRGAIVIDEHAMDLLLEAVDIIKTQFEELREGRELSAAKPELVEALTALADGKQSANAAASVPAAGPAPAIVEPPASFSIDPAAQHATAGPSAPQQASAAASETPSDMIEQPLSLPSNKADLIEFLVTDLYQTLEQVSQQTKLIGAPGTRGAAATQLGDLAESLRKAVEFFEFESMMQLASLFAALAEHAPRMSDAAASAAVAQADAVLALLKSQAEGLSRGKQVIPQTGPVCAAFLATVQEEHGLEASGANVPTATAAVGSIAFAGQATAGSTSSQPGVSPDAPGAGAEPADHAAAPQGPKSEPGRQDTGKADAKTGSAGAAATEATIRVEVGRLEALLNLVGELVLQKNRISALTRQLQNTAGLSQQQREAAAESAGALDRVTSDLQSAVMKTRMQPLEKIFGKYPRLVRDLARKLNKQMELVVEGADTEVDKSVIEELGDPLVHLMRNSADHGIESPEQRRAAGKPETGTIRLSASNTGGHVEIRIGDDGKGLDPAVLARKAVEKGVITQAEADAMSDRDKMRLIFKPGFSTAEKLSDVSGRGVGMDVVATNVAKIKGSIDLESTPGKGTTVIITIPLTVAIMSAMMVGVGEEIYAVPLSNIIEIVKPAESQLSSVNRCPVMRLRDAVLPLVDAGEALGQAAEARGAAPFAVVLTQNEKRFGLMVSRLIGQQEIVIKPLDEFSESKSGHGPVSGATVRDDGGVSLIVDIPRLMVLAEDRQRAA